MGLLFDKRTIAFRQTLVWASTNARLCLDKRSFVPRLPIVCKRSNGGSFPVVQSRGTSVPIEGIPRCFLGGVAMLSRESADAVHGIPSMVIRDPFDGYTGPLRWLYEMPLMEIRTFFNWNPECSYQIYGISTHILQLCQLITDACDTKKRGGLHIDIL